jgi:hypothetical protein
MRIDQAGQDGDLAEIHFVLGIAGRGTPGRDDPAAIDRQPAVSDGRLANRHEPPRTVTDQWEMTRRRLPDWLRAG